MSKQQLSLTLTSGQRASPAKTSHLLEWDLEADCEEHSQASSSRFLNLCRSVARKLLSSKTSTVFSLAMEDETSQSYSRRWMTSGMVWRGECLTANILESPNHAAESMLLECIETREVQEKFFLSQNAATGILRRVDRMKRNLPASFRQSLEILSKGR